MKSAVTITVNGVPRTAEVEPRTLLVHLLREHLNLTGTHVGCDTSNCGACTVWLDGDAVKSCTVLAVQADGREVTTIEGISENDELHPMQRASCKSTADRPAPHPQSEQLTPGDDTVLPIRQRGDLPIPGSSRQFGPAEGHNRRLVGHAADRGRPRRASGCQR